MNAELFSRKTLYFLILASLVILSVLGVVELLDTGTRVVFCDVGQGNGAYIRLSDGVDMIIDTGPPNNSFLTCLGSHMPFFDRTIEYAIISHPQSDHEGGLPEILRRYTVRQVLFADAFRSDPHVAKFRDIQRTTVYSFVQNGTFLSFGKDGSVLFFTGNAAFTHDDNDRSLVVLFAARTRQFLFTGDISSAVLSSLTRTYTKNKLILEIPHHGSQYGLSEYYLQKIRPSLAIISVGKNAYGHPAGHTLAILKKYHIPYKRTDKNGDIIFKE